MHLLRQGFEAFDVEEKGAWEELPGGGAALRLSIRSPDAGSHIVVFRRATAVSAVEAIHGAASSPSASGPPWLHHRCSVLHPGGPGRAS